jgi:hypothetical protein
VLLVIERHLGWGRALRGEGTEGLLLTLAVGRCAVVGCRVVFCEDAGAIVGAEDYDGVDGEEGHAGCHGWVS